MNSVCCSVRDFPADGGAMAERVREALLRAGWTDFDLFPIGGYRLRLEASSATLLHLFVEGLGADTTERPYLLFGDLFVPESLRVPCTTWLTMQRRSPGAWSELYRFDVWDEGAEAAFRHFYHLALLAWRAGQGSR